MIKNYLREMIDMLSSLKLAVICLIMGLGLLFAGTLAQVQHGIYKTQEIYFQSFFIYASIPGSTWKIPVLPGGYLLASVLCVNMILNMSKGFRWTSKKAGIYTIHLGLLLLGIGQVVSDTATQESRMVLDEGSGANYSESLRRSELVLIETSDSKYDTITSVPAGKLHRRRKISHDQLPFRIETLQWMPNSRVFSREKVKGSLPHAPDQGVGLSVLALPIAETGKVNEINLPSAYIRLIDGDQTIGTWLVSHHLGARQEFQWGDKNYAIQLRPKRFYKPYTVKLEDFRHDRYAGTDIPKNFSSEVTIIDERKNIERKVQISMNRPLRYDGDVYYQASFMNDDRTSILQVVRNIALPVPYVSCILISLGLLWQFGWHLLNYLNRKMVTA